MGWWAHMCRVRAGTRSTILPSLSTPSLSDPSSLPPDRCLRSGELPGQADGVHQRVPESGGPWLRPGAQCHCHLWTVSDPNHGGDHVPGDAPGRWGHGPGDSMMCLDRVWSRTSAGADWGSLRSPSRRAGWPGQVGGTSEPPIQQRAPEAEPKAEERHPSDLLPEAAQETQEPCRSERTPGETRDRAGGQGHRRDKAGAGRGGRAGSPPRCPERKELGRSESRGNSRDGQGQSDRQSR